MPEIRVGVHVQPAPRVGVAEQPVHSRQQRVVAGGQRPVQVLGDGRGTYRNRADVDRTGGTVDGDQVTFVDDDVAHAEPVGLDV